MLKVLIYLLMINPVTLSAKLSGLVGIIQRQPYNPRYQVLNDANMTSRSGYYVCGTENPFCKIELIKDTQDYEEITNDLFNQWLQDKMATSIKNVANWVFNETDVIDRQLIYINALNKYSETPTPDQDNTGRYVNCYTLPKGFNCYWIQPSRKKNVAFNIKSVNAEFNGSGSLTLYLFNTANMTVPLYKQTINIDNQPFLNVPLLDANGVANGWICDNSAGAGYKGDFYLGYVTEEVTGNLKPFKREYRSSIEMSIIKDLDYYRWNFPDFTNAEGATFDLMDFTTYILYNGINPDIIVYEDFTDLIVTNEKTFARAIQLDAQISFMREYISSIRSNRNERLANEMVMQIEGVSGDGVAKVQGLKSMLYAQVGQIKNEIKKLQEGNNSRPRIGVRTVC